MYYFCPFCGNLLFAEKQLGKMRFACKICPVFFPIKRTISNSTYFRGKALDDVMGLDSGWKNCEQTAERCPECNHPQAYFRQMQTRSADEPMTIFYRCCNDDCAFTWRE